MQHLIFEKPLITDDRVVFGLLFSILALLFWASGKSAFKKFFHFFPVLLLCYLIPGLLVSFNVISEETSGLYTMAKNYLLPAALFLLTLGIDIKSLIALGWKPLIMFLSGTFGVVIGGPIALYLVSLLNPELLSLTGNDELWRGLSTLAGSWIGGNANQTAMLEVFEYNKQLYGGMILVDIVVANIWMAILLYIIPRSEKIDRWLKADNSAVEELKERVQTFAQEHSRIPTLKDYMIIFGITFACVGVSHLLAEIFSENLSRWEGANDPESLIYSIKSSFFWLVSIITLLGLIFSLTKARKFEGAGASKLGSVSIYLLVTTIGMKMNVFKIFDNPWLVLIGLIWMAIHVGFLFLIARLTKSPFFFLAVGSKANIGGAASAPVVATAFHPSLASVGVLLAVLGYAVGTYGALICAMLMRLV